MATPTARPWRARALAVIAEVLAALAAVRAWTAGLFASLDRQDTHVAAGQLTALELPVTLAFGAADPTSPPSWPAT